MLNYDDARFKYDDIRVTYDGALTPEFYRQMMATIEAMAGRACPTAAEIAAAILAAAQITPIHSDVQKMNSAEVIGDGTAGDDWRGLGVPPTVV